MNLRVLVTGSRKWNDWRAIEIALVDVWAANFDPDDPRIQREHLDKHPPILIHGDAYGADRIAESIWQRFYDGLYKIESYRARDFPDPKARNQHMVDLGADVCLVFALKWASGTGHCARAARRAGIHTVDLGVSTAVEDRPGAAT